tara:strand:- start:1493 stop:2314 length:822 start_codon:yes stop_codon:yes gene_type:complete
MRPKHNKKRNTAFLYEALINELTKCVLAENAERKAIVVKILKENFGKNSVLAKELEIYKTLCEATDLQQETAKSLVAEAKRSMDKLKEKDIFEAQSSVISQINKELSKDVFNNFVPNYKHLATIVQMFSTSTPLKTRVLMESECLQRLTGEQKKETQALKPISNLTYKTFVKKFNEKYGSTLQTEQRDLLQNYILSFSDNGIGIKLFMNEELARLKEVISQSLTENTELYDSSMREKAKQVLQLLENCKTQELTREIIGDVLKVQALAREIQD